MVGREGKAGFSSERMFGIIRSKANADPTQASAGASPQILACPKCGPKTSKIWRDGTYTSMFGEPIQRYICRRCGYRFSDPAAVEAAKKRLQQDLSLETNALKTGVCLSSSRQICAEEAKNLVAEKQETVVLRKETFDINTTLAKYEWYLQKEGYRPATIIGRTKLLKILWRREADLYDPESVKTVISKQKWCEGRKGNAVDAYSSYLAMVGGTWTRPIYTGIAKLPFVPKEIEIDQLIAGCSLKVATFLQLLKETHARPGEIWHIIDDNFDFETNTVNITPEKNSNPRIFKIGRAHV
jgi:transposase-like protein